MRKFGDKSSSEVQRNSIPFSMEPEPRELTVAGEDVGNSRD